MPRARKTPGLEAGAAYGEVSDNLEAMAAIPLPQKAAIGTGSQPEGPVNPPIQPPAAPQPLPLEEARAFTPQVTPLTAPGRGISPQRQRPIVTPNTQAADLLRRWAEATGDPVLAEAAAQLSL